ncbi:anti-sigma factor family protein [Polyangium aurulentum]|uniref:anti-sigma factor family protein n=1 Tax=Polyangium aurulentum TaxID=2567896 RepID=UPI0010AEA786|nr:anti-sigma factor [Polyangium aurulentum]UQA61251.1 zf-HC2 domain-containing protein [Polyangium aurulentum]
MRGLKAMTDECSLHARWMSSYVDGELDAGHAVDMEAHVLRCGECSERVNFLRATRVSMKRTADKRAPDALRARVAAAMLAEKRRVKEADREHAGGAKLVSWKYAAALAAAAGVVLSIGATRNRDAAAPTADLARRGATEMASTMGVGFDSLIDDLVALHAHPLPPETTNPDELQRFDPLVGVPVRKPVFQPFGASFHGARVHAMRDRRAALLQYTVQGNHRVTVYVFDPRAVPMQATRLRPRVVRERSVFVGNLRGYSVAAAETRNGVGYALASDLSDDQSAQLVLAAVQQ